MVTKGGAMRAFQSIRIPAAHNARVFAPAVSRHIEETVPLISRCVAKVALLILVPILSGCPAFLMSLPTGQPNLVGGRLYDATQLSFLQQGQTEKSDVIA